MLHDYALRFVAQWPGLRASGHKHLSKNGFVNKTLSGGMLTMGAKRSFAAITTCKGRLHHLKQTLPLIAAAGFDEVIVVDYDCPDKTSEWVSEVHPDVRVVRVSDQSIFNVSRARNIGASASACSWLCFIDADVQIHASYLDWLRKTAAPGFFYRREKPANEQDRANFRGLYGTVACQNEVFHAIGGFDEVIRGWAMEDKDLFVRLLLAGCKVSLVPLSKFQGVIQHDDNARVAHYSLSQAKSEAVSRLYCSAKFTLMEKMGIHSIPFALRQEIYDLISTAFEDSAGHTAGAGISIELNEDLISQISEIKPSGRNAVPSALSLEYSHYAYEKQFDKQLVVTRIIKRAKRIASLLSKK